MGLGKHPRVVLVARGTQEVIGGPEISGRALTSQGLEDLELSVISRARHAP